MEACYWSQTLVQVQHEKDNSSFHRQNGDGEDEKKELESRRLNMREDGHKRCEEFDGVRDKSCREAGAAQKEAAMEVIVCKFDNDDEVVVVAVVHEEFDNGGDGLVAMEILAHLETEAEVGVHKSDKNFQDWEDCRGDEIGEGGTLEVGILGLHRDVVRDLQKEEEQEDV